MTRLLDFFNEGLRTCPNSIAAKHCVDDQDEPKPLHQITYANVNADSDTIASKLKTCDCQNEIVFVSSTTHISTVAIVLGILKVPAPFACLDWKNTRNHNLEFLRESGSRYLVVPQQEIENVTRLAIAYRMVDTFICFCGTLSVIELLDVQRRQYEYPGWQLGYVIQTSGTTGIPKMVKVPHRCVCPNIEHFRDLYETTAADVVFVASPFTFDPSIVDMFLAFSVGASLLLVSDRLKMVPDKLFACLVENQVTMMQVTPSLMRRFGSDNIRNTLLGPTTALRILGLGGERCPSVHTLRRWRHPRNTTKLFNVYGITEVSSWATVHQVRLADDYTDGIIPIGTPIRKTELQVKDEDGLEVDEGEGLLFVGGHRRVCFIGWEDYSEVSKSPMRATGDVVSVQADGQMTFVGRVDDQIKRNGKKVSRRQIETAASSVEGICDSIAIYNADRGHMILAAVVKSKSNGQPRKSAAQWRLDLRRHLMTVLPTEATPDRVVVMESLPITTHGKIDTRLIVSRAYTQTAEQQVALESLTGSAISDGMRDLWRLHLPDTAILPLTDDVTFVACGGDSLRAVSLGEDVNLWLGIEFSLLVDKLVGGRTLLEVCNYVESVVLAASGEVYGKTGTTVQNSNVVITTRGSRARHYGDGSGSDETGSTTACRVLLNPAWKFDTKKCVDSSPLILSNNGMATVFIGSHSHTFIAVCLETGQLRWSFTAGDRIESSACASQCGEFIFFGCYDHNVYCLESKTGILRWKFTAGGLVKCSPAFDAANEFLYFGAYDHFAYAVSSKSGELKWKVEIDQGSIFSSPCLSANPHQVYFATLAGTVTAICPDSGKTIWKLNLGMPVFSSPALVPDGVCVGCVNASVYCLDQSGNVRWTYRTEGPIFSSPCLFRSHPGIDVVLVGSHDQHLHCLDSCSGELRWKTRFGSPVYSTPFVCGEAICVSSSTNGTLRVVAMSNSQVLAEHTFPGETFSSVVVYGDKVVIGCRDNFVYCLDLIVDEWN